MNTFFILSIVFYVKHLLADIEFQTTYMMGKFKGGYEWVLPLLAHASVHGLFTLIIVLSLGQYHMAWLALFDMGIHFVIDRIKAHPTLGGRFKNALEKSYHRAYNLDQIAHHLTHLFIIYLLTH